MDLLVLTPRGIHCPQADLYVDPRSAVQHAIITHAHSDHARPGHAHYLTHHHSIPLLRQRFGRRIHIQGVQYGEPIIVNGVRVSLHPAGHILGSSQVRFEYGGRVWVVSGDYKLEDDSLSTSFEPLPCHVFITESTFGLPVFRWRKQEYVYQEINSWWEENQGQRLPSLLVCYALGKAQRILRNLDPSPGPIYAHDTMVAMADLYREMGFRLPEIRTITRDIQRRELQQALILVPPTFTSSTGASSLAPYANGYVSGWMALRTFRQQRLTDRGFVLSDHADWDGLNSAVRGTGAEKIVVMHGYTSPFARWLQEHGYDAREASFSEANQARGAIQGKDNP
jgi:putative mRNA 3-end processing factor